MSVSIIGMSHTKFGRLDDKSVYDLLLEAGRGALEDSKVKASDIGAIFVGNYSGGGFNNQEHLAPYSINIHPDLRFSSATRIENACASGMAAIHQAMNALESGQCEYALVIGVEKMNSLDTDGVTKTLAMASYYPEEGGKGVTFPGLFAEFAKGYMEKYNISEEDLTEGLRIIASKNYRNALNNPYAHMPKDLSPDDIKGLSEKNKNPMIAFPLRLHDCSLVSDGAAALVLTKTSNVKNNDKAIDIIGSAQVSDYLQLDKRDQWEFTASKIAIDKALKSAGLTINDISFAEVHDCFTIAEFLVYEALGIAEPGKALEIVKAGVTQADGKFPVNPSGGLKAKGHPVGATGVSMTVAASNQLLGTPIGAKVKDAKTALVINFGGSAVSNHVLILKKHGC